MIAKRINHISMWLLAIAVSPFIIDNGPDYVSDGYMRVVDEQGLLGYATEAGEVKIKPQFAFGLPFRNGVAKVTNTGKWVEVEGSDGEYHRFESDEWFCIDKSGAQVPCPASSN